MSANQPNYAETRDNFANDTPLQLTLRVMQAIYSNPRFWVGMAAVILILTIMGPFNTLVDMTFAPRLVYWGGISLVTFPVAMAVSMFVGIWLEQRRTPSAIARLIGGAIGGIPIGGLVFVANAYFAGTIDSTLANLIRMTDYTIPISAAISVIYYLVESSMKGNADAQFAKTHSQPPAATATPFLKRLPVELGKDIISLQAQDHYVRVNTTKGSEMVLIRLSDAESELEGIEGTRVHRSWWLARAHIGELKRENDKLIAVLSNGQQVPVSRTYAKQVRSWFHQ